MDPHDLYGLPLDQFVTERTALAKALRGAGERSEAARVGKLPKPSVAAWAVNQLVRTQREAVTNLFEAGDALQRAHADVVAGKASARALREAGERERAAVDALVDAARGLLTGEGHGLTQATLDRVSETLDAGALDAGARQAVSDACLHRELTRIGLGEAAFADEPAESGTAAKDPRPAKEEARRAAAAKEKARRVAERAAGELTDAQERRDRAAATLQEAEDALTAAKRRAAEAARALS